MNLKNKTISQNMELTVDKILMQLADLKMHLAARIKETSKDSNEYKIRIAKMSDVIRIIDQSLISLVGKYKIDDAQDEEE